MALIYPNHQVGDTIYYYDRDDDCVRRAVVKRITAQCTQAHGDWTCHYVVRCPFGGSDVTLTDADMHASATQAFPPLALAEEVTA